MSEKAPPIGTVLTGEAAVKTYVPPAEGLTTDLKYLDKDGNRVSKEDAKGRKDLLEVPIGISTDGTEVDLTFDLIEHSQGVKGWDPEKEGQKWTEVSSPMEKLSDKEKKAIKEGKLTFERVQLRRAIWHTLYDGDREVTVGGTGRVLDDGRKTYKTMEWGEIPQDEVEFPKVLSPEELAEIRKNKEDAVYDLVNEVNGTHKDIKDAIQTLFRIRAKKMWPKDEEGADVSPYGPGIHGLDNLKAHLDYVKSKIAIYEERIRNAKEGTDPLRELVESLSDEQLEDNKEKLLVEQETEQRLLKRIKKEIARQKKNGFNRRVETVGRSAPWRSAETRETDESAEDDEFPIGMRVSAPSVVHKKSRLDRFKPERSELGRDSWRIAYKKVRKPSLFDPDGLKRFGTFGKDKGYDPKRDKTIMLVNMQGDTMWVSLAELREANRSLADPTSGKIRPDLIWRDGTTQRDTLPPGGGGDGGGEDGPEGDEGGPRRRRRLAFVAGALVAGAILGLQVNDTIQDSHIQKNQAKIATFDRWSHKDLAHRAAVASNHEKAQHIRENEILRNQHQIEQNQVADAGVDQAIRDGLDQIKANQETIIKNQSQEEAEETRTAGQQPNGNSRGPGKKSAKGSSDEGQKGQSGSSGGTEKGEGIGRRVLVEPNDGFTQIIERNFPGYSSVAYDRAHVAALRRNKNTPYIHGIPVYKRSGAQYDIGFSRPGEAYWDPKMRKFIEDYLEANYQKQ